MPSVNSIDQPYDVEAAETCAEVDQRRTATEPARGASLGAWFRDSH